MVKPSKVRNKHPHNSSIPPIWNQAAWPSLHSLRLPPTAAMENFLEPHAHTDASHPLIYHEVPTLQLNLHAEVLV